MDLQNTVDFLVSLLSYTMPMAFLWSFAHIAVKAIIKAATGRIEDAGL